MVPIINEFLNTRQGPIERLEWFPEQDTISGNLPIQATCSWPNDLQK